MKLDYKKTIKVGLAFAIIMAFWTAYDYVIPLLLENTYGLSNMMRGLIMGLDNLLSLFMLPLFGKISDKSKSRFGRRTPFIVIGTVVSAILIIFVPVSSNAQLKQSLALREKITNTAVENYSYTDDKGVTYDAEALYGMLYDAGKDDSDYCDRTYFASKNEDIKNDEAALKARYMKIALNPYQTNDDGSYKLDKNGDKQYTEEYSNFVKTGINCYASDQINETITKKQPASLIVYMIILLFVLIAMATFRSPAVALMPDVTPKPLRSQANAMINLMGGVGGAIAFLIYTITLLINPTGYIAIFVGVGVAMLILLGLFLWLVNENKLVRECALLCEEYGISNDDEDEVPAKNGDDKELLTADPQKAKKARLVSLILILASIFMWFMGYNAISSNLSIYLTKTLGLSSGMGGIISGISMGISAVAFIPVGILAVKIGRRKSIMLGWALAVLSFILIFFFAGAPSSYAMYLFTIFYLIAGFGLIIANVNTFPMVVELSNSDTVGKYTGYYYAATMSAQAIAPFIAGAIMDKWGTKYLFLYSTICVIISIGLMFFVKHGDSKAPPPKSKLEYLGADD